MRGYDSHVKDIISYHCFQTLPVFSSEDTIVIPFFFTIGSIGLLCNKRILLHGMCPDIWPSPESRFDCVSHVSYLTQYARALGQSVSFKFEHV